MASVVKESSSDVPVNLSYQLGGLKQKLAVEALLWGEDLMAILPNRSHEIHYISNLRKNEKLYQHGFDRGCFPLRSIIVLKYTFVSSIYLLRAP